MSISSTYSTAAVSLSAAAMSLSASTVSLSTAAVSKNASAVRLSAAAVSPSLAQQQYRLQRESVGCQALTSTGGTVGLYLSPSRARQVASSATPLSSKPAQACKQTLPTLAAQQLSFTGPAQSRKTHFQVQLLCFVTCSVVCCAGSMHVTYTYAG